MPGQDPWAGRPSTPGLCLAKDREVGTSDLTATGTPQATIRPCRPRNGFALAVAHEHDQRCGFTSRSLNVSATSAEPVARAPPHRAAQEPSRCLGRHKHQRTSTGHFRIGPRKQACSEHRPLRQRGVEPRPERIFCAVLRDAQAVALAARTGML